MSEFTSYPPGTFCWAELGTPDAPAGKRFYMSLFGWGFEDRPVGPDTVYTMFKVGGKDVAALYTQAEQERARGVPPHWASYVSVASADESAGKAASLGGTVLAQPFDVMEVGRMAVIQDPTGAVFSLWQPKQHHGAQLANEPGAFCWNELLTSDVDRATAFYTGLFGWGAQTRQMGPMTYTVFSNGERPSAGLMKIAEEWGPVPSNWLVYFAVDDCDRAVEKAKGLKAKVMTPPRDIPEVGRFAVLQDPQGATFAIIKLLNVESMSPALASTAESS
ncbi:MAG TPA: VOC family protein [Gemmatimonadota bacterium]|jgi:predicted enzyme related to lactoylglutathione lyase